MSFFFFLQTLLFSGNKLWIILTQSIINPEVLQQRRNLYLAASLLSQYTRSNVRLYFPRVVFLTKWIEEYFYLIKLDWLTKENLKWMWWNFLNTYISMLWKTEHRKNFSSNFIQSFQFTLTAQNKCRKYLLPWIFQVPSMPQIYFPSAHWQKIRVQS